MLHNNREESLMTLKEKTKLEFYWTIIPFALLLGISVWSLAAYSQKEKLHPNAVEVTVIAKKWQWKFVSSIDSKNINEVIVPEGKPLKFILTSEDVVHGFYCPALQIKSNAVPNLRIEIGASPLKKGVFEVYCTDDCGIAHKDMVGKIHVVSEAEYQSGYKE